MSNKIPIIVADYETQLSEAISATDVSFKLASATDDDGIAIPAGKYCFTVNNGSSNKQYLMGQLNGTDVTSVVTVSRQGVESGGAARAARAGSSVMISNFATIQRVEKILRGLETLDGSSPIEYDAEPTLGNREELATVGYVLDTITGGTVNFDNQVITGVVAGEDIVAGDLVYFKTSDQEWYKTDADTATTVNGVQLGVALGAGSDGVAIAGGVQISGVYTTSGLTAGSTYYASNTAGGFSDTAGTTEKSIGIALSATKLFITLSNPDDLSSFQINYLNQAEATSGVVFGGDGSDGALNVTSGTTTLPLGVEYNYTSITIASGATLTVSGGGDGDEMLVLKCQGDFVNEGTIDLAGKGAAGGAGGAGKDTWSVGTADSGTNGTSVQEYVDGTTPDGGIGGDGAEVTSTTNDAPDTAATAAANKNATYFVPAPLNGAGGGGGGGGTRGNTGNTGGDGGAGGNGGVALVLEVAGSFDNAGTITVNGEDGTVGQDSVGNGSNSTDVGAGGGGGGGAAGSIYARYKGALTDSGTLTAAGGSGGIGGVATNKSTGGGTLYQGVGGAGGGGGASFFEDGEIGNGASFDPGGARGDGGDGIVHLAKYYA